MKNKKKATKQGQKKDSKSSHPRKGLRSQQSHQSSINSRKSTPNKSPSIRSRSKNHQTPKPTGKKKVDSTESANEDDKNNFLPGQKYKTPEEDNGALAFYKSLYEQNPHSEMARRYCLEYGVLEYDEAKRVQQSLCKPKPRK